MHIIVERTLFLLDLSTLEVTIYTWQGQEATLPISHLCSLVDSVRSSSLPLPACPPALREGDDPEDD